MNAPTQIPSLPRLEHHIRVNDHEAACAELLDILYQLDSNFASLHQIDFDFPPQLAQLEHERHVYFCTRMADAISQLFRQPELQLSETGFQRFMIVQRWLALIFASSPYINADHILKTYNQNPNAAPLDVYLDDTANSLMKFCVLYLPESNVNVNLDVLWAQNPQVCVSLCFALQSPRFIGTDIAFTKRANILQWLPEKLAQLDNLNGLPNNILHDVYMHCSYDAAQNKHLIKKELNKLIRRHLLQMNWQDRHVDTIATREQKPVMVVVLEHFNAAHSIYRTHSTSMIAAKAQFYVVGIGNKWVDATGRAVFDAFYELPDTSVVKKLILIKEICEEYGAAVFYMPSIGMDLLPIFASNTRLAPVQAIALGHPATTHSEFIEYVIVEDDYVGNEACFSETLLRLPKDALPYVPSALAPTVVDYHLRPNPEVVQIGVAATTMKLNPYFLEACRAIRDRARVKVHFHFALGQSNGITHPYVARFIRSYLGDNATAHPHQPYEQYLNILNQCDMLINPFPFGNTNGIIDMITLGLVGVCKTGDEVHEHIDEGLFKRLGLPEWLITHSADEYVDCAVRLAENHDERLALRRHIIENNGLQTLFTGDPRPLGQVLAAKVRDLLAANQPVAAPKKSVSKNKKKKKR
ncbi:UDP-glucose:protein N-beta-glucosyltransferase [Alysiella crassa]|uniref:Predicted O-linked N-acetylglucosamine transferase, SPINDLY family n=1 Tax=Alysiella crassa TaxID=153491 RepID=A0A376BTQ6_9NEIS|nr:adhesin [Alysiella crassa]UOP05938.1 adhesin [Alysiella crassa]SSY80367.1 Predicted O-linked N-acetylglucosamine transferase, SPINDLY family [Alysiella crassa]